MASVIFGQTFRDITKFAEALAKRSTILQHRAISLSTRSLSHDVHYLERGETGAVAYRTTCVSNPGPGVIFVPGYMSNMHGIKATALEKYCQEKNLSYTRFDYQGCGMSRGDMRHMTLTDWKNDLLSIIDRVTAGPQVMVGSSMGGLLMILAAMERPNRIHSLIGVGTVAEFDVEKWTSAPGVKEELEETGLAHLVSEYGETILTQKFINDAHQHSLLKRESIPLICPVRLLHGVQDKSVPHEMSLRIAEKLWSTDVDVLLKKEGDHRLSQPDDIHTLFEMLNNLIFGAKDVRDLAISSWHSFSLYSYPNIQAKNATKSQG